MDNKNILLPSLKTVTSSVKAKTTTATTSSKDKENEAAVPSKGYSMDWMNDPSAFAGGQVPQTKKVDNASDDGSLADRIAHKVRGSLFFYFFIRIS